MLARWLAGREVGADRAGAALAGLWRWHAGNAAALMRLLMWLLMAVLGSVAEPALGASLCDPQAEAAALRAARLPPRDGSSWRLPSEAGASAPVESTSPAERDPPVPLVFTDGAPAPGGGAFAPHFRFAGRLGATSLWLVRACPASPTAPPLRRLLIDPQTLQVLVDERAIPAVSPDATLVAIALPAGPAGAGGGVRLLQRREVGWAQVYRFDAPLGMGFSVEGWREDSAALKLTWSRQALPVLHTGCSGAIQLRDGAYGWDWVPDLPPSLCP